MKSKLGTIVVDVIYDAVGAVLYTVGVSAFTAPNDIAPGGVTGLATIANALWGVPIGTVTFAVNIPLLFLALKMWGKALTLKTLKSVAIMSVVIDVLSVYMPKYEGDALLAAVFGGLCIGAGLGAIFSRDSTTGGTDIVAGYIREHLPHIQIGKVILLIDALVLALAAVTYKNIETFLYGVITIFVTTKIMDAIIYGVDTGKVALIISEKKEEIAAEVLKSMDRGCTFLEAKGAYSEKDRDVLMCAVRKRQFPQLKKITYELDGNAFLIVVNADEILGYGFKEYDDKDIG